MGLEANCTVRFGKQSSRGKALLESEQLVFRGGFRLVIPFRTVQSVTVENDELRIKFPGGTANFDLGQHAENWARKILNPKTLIDKLGVKPGAVVSLVGLRDPDFRRQLRARTSQISEATPRKSSDLIFFLAEERGDLRRLAQLTASLAETGAIWVIYPKGQRHITQGDVMVAAKKARLVDVKVASFSATHTTLKLVIPLARR